MWKANRTHRIIAPTLNLLKANDKTARVCGDYWLTSNMTWLQRICTTGKPKAVVYGISGSICFPQIELIDAYCHIQLDDLSNLLGVTDTSLVFHKFSFLNLVCRYRLNHFGGPFVFITVNPNFVTFPLLSNDTQDYRSYRSEERRTKFNIFVNLGNVFSFGQFFYLGYKLLLEFHRISRDSHL